MKIKKMEVNNYRNYDNLKIDFSDTLNIIYGNNGSGKSNLIEAVYVLALTKSFRTNNDRHLIKKDKEEAKIKAIVETNEKTQYQIDLTQTGKRVYVDSDKVSRISDYVSKINIILFNPLDTKVINDSPATRRRLIDIEISQINREYLLLLNMYNKTLKHRNAYLKQLYINGNASSEYLDILTKKLIDYGIKIRDLRKSFIDSVNDYITNIYKNIFEYGNLKIKYKSSLENKDFEKIFELYKKNYRSEMILGKTMIGIHHDDIEFLLDGYNIKEFGSVGQQKNSIISFKLAELLIIKKNRNEYPILILDDLFSELDNQKVNNIISMLNKEVQTFITTTDIEKINKELLKDSTLYKVDNGKVERNDL